LITLTTDLDSVYVAQMKGAILSLDPGARIVDVDHTVGAFNVRRASFVLLCAARLFPETAVHVCVVDPGVGSSRRSIILYAGRGIFVGPDNGVFTLPLSLGSRFRAFSIDHGRIEGRTGRRISSTFHGRDVFAPVAALLDMGEPPEVLGEEIDDIETFEVTEPRRGDDGVWGSVLFVDGFGNVVTNIPAGMIEASKGADLLVSLRGKTYPCTSATCYSDAEPGQLIALVGSQDTYELSVNRESASRLLGAVEGDAVRISEE